MGARSQPRDVPGMDAMKKNPTVHKDCKRLIQAIACLSRCPMCGKQAQVGHHLIGCAFMYWRYELKNILPLCDHHHTGSTKHSAELAPKWFKRWFASWNFDWYEWWQDNRTEPHKNPQLPELLATRKRLEAFLAAGEAWVWSKHAIH